MIILAGVAGSGKSMQGRLLADEQGFAWISTGELLRILITGQQRHLMLQGELLSDQTMIEIIDKIFELINLSEEFVLDGFPRTIGQTQWLLDQSKMKRLKIDAVFHLTAPQEIVRQRLRGRGRIDDTDNAISRRFEEYETVTSQIVDIFRANEVPVYDIDASQSPKRVHDRILDYFNNLNVNHDN